MFHNLQLGPDAEAAARLARLRGLRRSGAIEPGRALVPGIRFEVDPEADGDGDYESAAGMLVAATLRLRRPARWLALHLALGPAALDPGGIAGFALRGHAPGPFAFRACLRSGRAEGGFTERFFDKTVLLAPEPGLHLDARPLADVPAAAPWREFILFADPPQSCRFTLTDLRLFLI